MTMLSTKVETVGFLIAALSSSLPCLMAQEPFRDGFFSGAQEDNNTTGSTTNATANNNSSVFESLGASDCPCIDISAFLAPWANCQTTTDNHRFNSTISSSGQEKDGFWLCSGVSSSSSAATAGGSCYPISYGSTGCAAHDRLVDPHCVGVENPPDYCSQEWCYVDPQMCKQSHHHFSKSEVLPIMNNNDDARVFYSYTTCNSTNKAWEEFKTTDSVAGKTLTVIFPSIWYPAHFKESPKRKAVNNDNEEYELDIHDDFGIQHYHDDAIPFQGWVVDYLESILAGSNMAGFRYTSRSIGSDAFSSSFFTASVADVRAGVGDVVATNLWITSERLAMSSFTIQTAVDKLYLWVESPTIEESGFAKKVLEPFDWSLWLCLWGSILVASFLGLVFATPLSYHRPWWKELRSHKCQQADWPRKLWLYFRMFCDAFIAYSTFFFGHTIEYDTRASYPSKILNFGFGFLILIAVTAYTANLAAFLTVAGVSNYIENIEMAIEQHIVLCAPGALRVDLEQAWPNAKFVYYESSPIEMVDSYDKGECQALVGSEWDIRQDLEVLTAFCDPQRQLIQTSSVVLETPLGFAIDSKYAAGLSFWMEQAEKNGTSYAGFEAATRPKLPCSLDIPEVEVDEMAQLTPANFVLPFLVFVVCAGTALVLHFFGNHRAAEKRKTFMAAHHAPPSLQDIHDDDNNNATSHLSSSSSEKRESAFPQHEKKLVSFAVGQRPSDPFSDPSSDVDSDRPSYMMGHSTLGGLAGLGGGQNNYLESSENALSTVPEDQDVVEIIEEAGEDLSSILRNSTRATTPTTRTVPDGNNGTSNHQHHQRQHPRNSTGIIRRRTTGGSHASAAAAADIARRRSTRPSLLDIPTYPEDVGNLQIILEMMRELQTDHERLQADQRVFFAQMMKAGKKDE